MNIKGRFMIDTFQSFLGQSQSDIYILLSRTVQIWKSEAVFGFWTEGNVCIFVLSRKQSACRFSKKILNKRMFH